MSVGLSRFAKVVLAKRILHHLPSLFLPHLIAACLPYCQRVYVTPAIWGELKSSHFERGKKCRWLLSTGLLLAEAGDTQRTEVGDCRSDPTLTRARILRPSHREERVDHVICVLRCSLWFVGRGCRWRFASGLPVGRHGFIVAQVFSTQPQHDFTASRVLILFAAFHATVRLLGSRLHQAIGKRKALPAISDGGDGTAVLEMSPARVGRRSNYEPNHELIAAQLDQGLSVTRILQDLVPEHGLAGSDDSVKRFVRRRGDSTMRSFSRLEAVRTKKLRPILAGLPSTWRKASATTVRCFVAAANVLPQGPYDNPKQLNFLQKALRNQTAYMVMYAGKYRN